MILPFKATTSIEKATTTDIPDLVDIHAKSFARGWTSSEFNKLLADQSVMCLVLRRTTMRVKDKIAGFVLIRMVIDESEILTIAVDPDARKAGVGYELMSQTLRTLYAERQRQLFLEVDEVNEAAIGLYFKLGFEKVGERKGYYTTGKDKASKALIMQIDLA